MYVYRLQTPLCCAAGTCIHIIGCLGFKPHICLTRLVAHLTCTSSIISHFCISLSIGLGDGASKFLKMSNGKQSRPFSWRRSIFRQKNKAISEENTHHSSNATQSIEEPPIKVAQTIKQFDLTVSSQSPNLRPTSGVGDGPAESPGTTATESDLWSRAYQELDEKSRKWISDTSELKPENGKQWTTDLITLVREREEAYKDSSPKLKIGDREIIWRDYANKTVTWLVTIGDIAVNFAPVPSPIIRSSLKVFMKVCSCSISNDILL